MWHYLTPLCSFWKIAMGIYTNQLNERIKLIDKANYYRHQYQSFMTAPEWRSVEMTLEYAKHMSKNNSIFNFPYFRQITELWKVVFYSYSAARKYNTRTQVLFSDYMLMNVFIALFTTFELIPKGIIAIILNPFLNKNNPTKMQKYLSEYYMHHAHDLETTPFYDSEYQKIREILAKKYEALEGETTWVDWFSWTLISMELRAKAFISKPIQYWFHQENNTTPFTTDILIKINVKNTNHPDKAVEQFKKKINKIGLSPKTPVEIVNDRIYTKAPKIKPDGTHYTSIYAQLRVPRYKAFLPTIKKLTHSNVHIKRIAGQNHIQVKYYLPNETLGRMSQIPIYTYQNKINSHYKFCLFDLPVQHLQKQLVNIEKKYHEQATFIHNF